jgi:hypothetical protein
LQFFASAFPEFNRDNDGRLTPNPRDALVVTRGRALAGWLWQARTCSGQPLPTALVVFHPEADGSSGYGSVDTDGSYYAKTGSQTGLKPGKYRITVVANKPEVVNYQAGPKVPTPITPTRYASPETSGFVVTLTDSGATYDLELKGK